MKLNNKFFWGGLTLASVAALMITVSASIVDNQITVLGDRSVGDYSLTLNSESGVTESTDFTEATYDVYKNESEQYSLVFSSIKALDGAVGVLESGSTITQTGPLNDISTLEVSFTGGELEVYSYFVKDDEGGKIKYNITSGLATEITGNYLEFVAKAEITLTNLHITYGCSTPMEKPEDPRDLIANKTPLRIEAEDSSILGKHEIGTENKTLEEVNHPSGDKYVYGMNVDENKLERSSLNYFVNADRAGLAVLTMCLGLNSERSLKDIYTVYLNGASLSYYNDITVPPYSEGPQYFEWKQLPCVLLNLNEGINVISIRYRAVANALNFDYIELNSVLSLSYVPTYNQLFNADTATAYGGNWNAPSETHPVITNGFYGSTQKQTFTFEFSVEEDSVAVFAMYGARNKPKHFDELFSTFTLNGSKENYIKDSGAGSGMNSWFFYGFHPFAILHLAKGKNNITFTIASKQSTNVAGVDFISTSPVTMPVTE